jgi:CrcB protein
VNGGVPASSVTLAAVIAVAAGGAVGSVTRYLTTLALARYFDAFPVGTLLVNVVGAFLIGAFARLFSGADHDPVLRLALTTGLCGGFTTFSAMSAETIALVQQGRIGRAALYVTASLVLGFGATALGLGSIRPRS